MLVSEQVLDEGAVLPRHAGMMDREPVWQQVLELGSGLVLDLQCEGRAKVRAIVEVRIKLKARDRWEGSQIQDDTLRSAFLTPSASCVRISREALSSPRYLPMVLFSIAMSRSIFAVFAVSLRECTNTNTYRKRMPVRRDEVVGSEVWRASDRSGLVSGHKRG